MIAQLVSADTICTAVEQVLRENLNDMVEALGAEARHKPIVEWQQLPTAEALASAVFPAAAITSSGLTRAPIYQRSTDSWSTTWRIAVGIYDRGGDHAATAALVRDWCALVRTVLTTNRTLGGIADSVTWAGEQYALVPRKEQARTFGGGAVALDVTADVPRHPTDQSPLVQSTDPSLTAEPASLSEE